MTGDLPGWGRADRCSADAVIDRDPLAEQDVPVTGAALGDEDWENPEAEEETEVGTPPPGNPGQQGTEQREEEEVTRPLFDPDLEPSGLQTRDILPECWEYKGSCRPDGLLWAKLQLKGGVLEGLVIIFHFFADRRKTRFLSGGRSTAGPALAWHKRQLGGVLLLRQVHCISLATIVQPHRTAQTQ